MLPTAIHVFTSSGLVVIVTWAAPGASGTVPRHPVKEAMPSAKNIGNASRLMNPPLKQHLDYIHALYITKKHDGQMYLTSFQQIRSSCRVARIFGSIHSGQIGAM